jgi:hypothetical protein
VSFGSRQKGSRAELEVASILQTWWSKHSPGAIFKRVPLSGGWGDADARAKFRSAGDVMTSCMAFPFSVEVKRRDGWAWKTLLAGKKSPVWEWWKQAVSQSVEMRATPLLWFRKNRQPWSVMLPLRVLIANISSHDDRIAAWSASDSSSPLRWMGSAMRMWLPSELVGVDIAGVEPALISAERFLHVPPRQWVKACRYVAGK